MISALLLWKVVRSTPDDRAIPEIDYSHFMSDVDAGNVASGAITGTRIDGQYREGKRRFRLIGPSNLAAYLDAVRNKGVEIRFRDAGNGSGQQMLGTWAPLISAGRVVVFHDPGDEEEEVASAGRNPSCGRKLRASNRAAMSLAERCQTQGTK